MNERDDQDEAAAEYALGTLDAQARADLDVQRRSDPHLDAAIRGWERLLSPLAIHVPEIEPPPHILAQIERRLFHRRRLVARGIIAGALALAACLVVAVALLFGLRSSGPVYVAQLRRDGGPVAFALDLAADRRILTARPVNVAAQSGKSLELWLVPAGAKPVAIGLLDPNSNATFSIADAARAEAATWAVTLEPPGGSPTGGPTGPVVFSGRFVKS